MVRKGKAEDCRGIYELICDMEEKELPWDVFSQMYGEMLADSRHVFLVWEEEKRMKGVLHLRMERQLHHAALVAEIMEFAVDKNARSNGILYDFCILVVSTILINSAPFPFRSFFSSSLSKFFSARNFR